MLPFRRHCQTCAGEFRETKASLRFCTLICEESFLFDRRCCPNCGSPVSGINARKEFCSIHCKRAHNKRKFYPVRGSYNKPGAQNSGMASNKNEWLKRILVTKKKSCKKRDILFNCSVDDFTLPDRCPVFDIVLKYPPNREDDDRDAYPSIDRIRPAMGYVSGNVRIISFRANVLKNAATAEESILLANDAWNYLPGDHPWHLQAP